MAADENLHHLFYRDLATAAIAASPSTMMEAIERQVVGFSMPGLGIPGFAGHAAAIAKAGVYDLAIHHEQILVPMLLRHWQIDRLEGLDAAGRAGPRSGHGPARQERAGRPPAQRTARRRSPRSEPTTELRHGSRY